MPGIDQLAQNAAAPPPEAIDLPPVLQGLMEEGVRQARAEATDRRGILVGGFIKLLRERLVVRAGDG